MLLLLSKACSCTQHGHCEMQMDKMILGKTWTVDAMLWSVQCHPEAPTICATAERMQIRCARQRGQQSGLAVIQLTYASCPCSL